MDFVLIVIGSGPGGYVAAIRAAQLGLKCAIVGAGEPARRHLPELGVHPHQGALEVRRGIREAVAPRRLRPLRRREAFSAFDFAKVIERSRGVAKQLNSGVGFLMKKHKIEVIEGTAKLEKGTPAPKVVIALKAGGSRTVQAKNVMLATGARARAIPQIGREPQGQRLWAYRQAMTPKALPKIADRGRLRRHRHRVRELLSRARLRGHRGGGAGAHPAGGGRRGLQGRAEGLREARHQVPRVPAKVVTKVSKSKTGVSVEIEVGGKKETLTADVVISAVGISANVENIGAEALGLELDRGHVKTGSHCETNVPGLYAIGDCAGPPWLAHKASHEGIHAVEHVAGFKSPKVVSPIPGCTYSQPQIASVGLTEAQARAGGREIKVGRFPFKVNGKAIAAGETEGFVKTVFDAKTGAQLIGAHMIGAEVTEMIQGFVDIAMTLEATEEDLMATVFPHPTMSEAMHEASLDAFGRVLHI